MADTPPVKQLPFQQHVDKEEVHNEFHTAIHFTPAKTSVGIQENIDTKL